MRLFEYALELLQTASSLLFNREGVQEKWRVAPWGPSPLWCVVPAPELNFGLSTRTWTQTLKERVMGLLSFRRSHKVVLCQCMGVYAVWLQSELFTISKLWHCHCCDGEGLRQKKLKTQFLFMPFLPVVPFRGKNDGSIFLLKSLILDGKIFLNFVFFYLFLHTPWLSWWGLALVFSFSIVTKT